MNNMKVQIKLQISNKIINTLARYMEGDYLESIYRTEVLSFKTEKPLEWLTDGRKIAFQNKMNENKDNEDLYKVESIGIINE